MPWISISLNASRDLCHVKPVALGANCKQTHSLWATKKNETRQRKFNSTGLLWGQGRKTKLSFYADDVLFFLPLRFGHAMYIVMYFVCYVHQLFCIYERMDVISCSWNQGKMGGNKEESKKETKRRKQKFSGIWEWDLLYFIKTGIVICWKNVY